MVNEGAKILDEKYAIRGSDIDVVWTKGYGGRSTGWSDVVGRLAGPRRRRGEDPRPRRRLGGPHWSCHLCSNASRPVGGTLHDFSN